MVERLLAKEKVESSNLFARLSKVPPLVGLFVCKLKNRAIMALVKPTQNFQPCLHYKYYRGNENDKVPEGLFVTDDEN